MAPNPYRVRRIARDNPYGNFKRVRRLHSTGTFSKRYLFGGHKLNSNRRHIALAGHKRHIFGGKLYADYTRAGKFRLPQEKVRRIYSHHLRGEFRGNVVNHTVPKDSTTASWW